MEEVQSVPVIVYESMSSRLCRIIRWMVTGWALTAVALGLVIVLSFSYSEDVMTETTEVAQEADNYGSNTFADGDYYGSTTDHQDNSNNSQAKARTGNIYSKA